MVRRLRGRQGKRARAYAKRKAPAKRNGPFDALPPGLVELKDWEAYKITGPAKVLVISDIHVPYHSDEALRIALEAGKESGCDTIVINGDFLDNYGVSRWERDPRQVDFKREVRTGTEVLQVIRKGFPKAKIVYKFGNHDERLEAYLKCKAPEVLDIEEFRLESLLKCEELGVDVVTDMRPMLLGKLWLIHGHEYRFSISNPVNPARGLFLRSKVHAGCGHFHQSSQHSEKGLDDSVVSCWSFGCLCDMRPRYMPLNKWNHGFGVVEIKDEGAFNIENRRIIHGGSWE